MTLIQAMAHIRRVLTPSHETFWKQAMTDIGKLNIQFSDFLYALRRGSNVELQTSECLLLPAPPSMMQVLHCIP